MRLWSSGSCRCTCRGTWWQIDAKKTLNDAVSLCLNAFVFSSGSSISVGEHGLVEVQVKLVQLPQDVLPLLGFVSDRADVQLPLEILSDDCATVSARESHRVIRVRLDSF